MFGDLPAETAQRLARVSRVAVFPSGASICQQGDTASDLFLVLDGQVSLLNTTANGESIVVEVIQNGGHFGLAAVLARLPYLATARANAQSRILMVDGNQLLDLVHTEPTLLSRIIRAEALDFRSMVQQICDLKFRTTSQRLGCYLLTLVSEQVQNSASFKLPFDKRLLAGRLGCRQENLSRAFAALRSVGVETHGASVILHDIARLREYSLPDEAPEAV